jgi:hypothetical protein
MVKVRDPHEVVTVLVTVEVSSKVSS